MWGSKPLSCAPGDRTGLLAKAPCVPLLDTPVRVTSPALKGLIILGFAQRDLKSVFLCKLSLHTQNEAPSVWGPVS